MSNQKSRIFINVIVFFQIIFVPFSASAKNIKNENLYLTEEIQVIAKSIMRVGMKKFIEDDKIPVEIAECFAGVLGNPKYIQKKLIATYRKASDEDIQKMLVLTEFLQGSFGGVFIKEFEGATNTNFDKQVQLSHNAELVKIPMLKKQKDALNIFLNQFMNANTGDLTSEYLHKMGGVCAQINLKPTPKKRDRVW